MWLVKNYLTQGNARTRTEANVSSENTSFMLFESVFLSQILKILCMIHIYLLGTRLEQYARVRRVKCKSVLSNPPLFTLLLRGNHCYQTLCIFRVFIWWIYSQTHTCIYSHTHFILSQMTANCTSSMSDFTDLCFLRHIL